MNPDEPVSLRFLSVDSCDKCRVSSRVFHVIDQLVLCQACYELHAIEQGASR